MHSPRVDTDLRDLLSRDLLIAGCAGIAVLNGLFAVNYWLSPSGDRLGAEASTTLLCALLAFASALSWRRRALRFRTANNVLGAVLTIAIANALWLLWLHREVLEAVFVVILLLVSSSIVLRWNWLLAHTVVVAGACAAAGAMENWSAAWWHWASLLGWASVAAWLVLVVRRRSFLHLDAQHRLIRERSDQLEQLVETRASELLHKEEALQLEKQEGSATRATNEGLLRAMDQANEGLVILDARGNLLYGNESFFAQMERRRSEVDSIWSLADDDADERLLAEIRSSLRQGKPWAGRYPTRTRQGEQRYRDTSISPVLDDQQRPQAYVGVVRDVTHEVELEHRLLQTERIDSVGRLAGGVAHDFNNLLTVILGFTENLLADLEPESTAWEDAQGIQQAATSAADLTRQLLAIGRKQLLEPAKIDLNACVTRVCELLHRLVREDIEFHCKLDDRQCPVFVDPGQIEQVITNLVTNARDAMPDGGELLVRTSIRAGSPSSVELVVQDTGTGIPPELEQRVFEPFFTTKSGERGTGLGLAQVYGIVQQSGGEVSLESELGVGTTIRIVLPLLAEPVDCRPSGTGKPADTPGTPAASGNQRRQTVLLVEDEAAVRNLVRRVLESHQYRVVEALDGQQGLEVGLQHAASIDLIVSDVVMPHLSGPAMVERLRPTCGAPVVFMTGYAGDCVAGLDGYDVLEKPFQPTTLLQTVRYALRSSDGLAEPGRPTPTRQRDSGTVGERLMTGP